MISFALDTPQEQLRACAALAMALGLFMGDSGCAVAALGLVAGALSHRELLSLFLLMVPVAMVRGQCRWGRACLRLYAAAVAAPGSAAASAASAILSHPPVLQGPLPAPTLSQLSDVFWLISEKHGFWTWIVSLILLVVKAGSGWCGYSLYAATSDGASMGCPPCRPPCRPAPPLRCLHTHTLTSYSS